MSSSTKKAHPVVVAPEPLLPAAPQASVASRPMSTMQATVAATQIEPDPSTFNDKKSAESDFMGPDSPSPHFKSTAPAMARPDDEMTMRPPAQEPGMYPVGYTPAVRSVNAIQVNSLNTALSHYNRGVYYSQRKQWDQAVVEYNQAITLNITLADAYVGLSTAALHKRDWENALRNGHQALRLTDTFLEPANITQARYNLSTVYCVADDYTRASRYYEQVKQSGQPEADELWAFLQSNCHP
jgi:tetratricopeptide (TPR) repeat protein